MFVFRRLALLVLVCFAASVAWATTINVGPGQLYPTIQSGINAAGAGDTVLVAPGIYFENIDFKGKAITVTSSAGAATTIIDGGGARDMPTVRFVSGELRTSVLSGMTIRGGGSRTNYNTPGGGVYVSASAPLLLNNVMNANNCSDVLVDAGAPLLQGNMIGATLQNNGACFLGGGILVSSNGAVGAYSHTDLIGNTVDGIGPFYSGIALNNADGTVIEGNIIRNSGGYFAGGLYVQTTRAITIVQNLFYGNAVTSPLPGFPSVPNGMTLQVPGTSVGPFVGIIAGNTVTDGLMISGNQSQYLIANNIFSTSSATTPAVACTFTDVLTTTPPSFDHNDVYNSAGPGYGIDCPDQTGTYGNISADPLFASAATGNYGLTTKSPALDAGNNSAPSLPSTDFGGTPRVQNATGLGAAVVDMGAYEFAGAPDAGHAVLTLTPSEYFPVAAPGSAPPPLSFTVRLSSAAGQPGGSVAIYEDTTLLGVVAVNSAGVASQAAGNVATGLHSFTAVYPAPGSGPHGTSLPVAAVSPRLYLLVPSALPSLTISSLYNPTGHPGAYVIVTIHTNVIGPVTLTDTSTNTLLATLTPDATGTASYTTTALAAGTHVIVAALTPSGGQPGASATLTQGVDYELNTSTLSIVSPATAVPIAYGTPVTASVAFRSNYGGPYPLGTVTFFSNGVMLGIANPVGNVTTFKFALPPGRDNLTCLYSGDTFYAPSSCTPVVVDVAQPMQTIVFPPPAAPAYAAIAVALNAVATSGLPVTYTVVSGPASVVGSTLTYQGAGPVVIEADQAGNGVFPAAAPVQQTVNVTLLTQPLSSASSAVTTLVTILNAGTLSSLTVSTQGAVGLDFSLAPGSTCVVGATYAAGQTCQANFLFTPLHPGLRYGGIALADATGALLANSYLLGLGTGPQVLFAPPNQTTQGIGFGGLSGIAVDGAGNVYASDYVIGGVYEISAATGATRLLTQTAPATDIAVDGSGNVFFTTRSIAGEVLAVNGVIPATPTVRTLTSGLTAINGMKVDATGNVFIASGTSAGTFSYIQELLAVNGSVPANPVIRTLVSNVGAPTGVAIDVIGNVYFSDGTGNSVYELVAVGGSIPASPTVRVVSSSFGQPTNVFFDVSGNLYVPDAGTHAVEELLAVNLVLPASPTILSLGAGLGTPAGGTVDAGGSLYVADLTIAQVVKLAYGSAPTLNFAATQIGSTSVDSPKTVTITNGGNAPLSVPVNGGARPGNPQISRPDYALNTASTCPAYIKGMAQLNAGVSCTFAVNFAPTQAGSLPGTLALTDNNLGVTPSVQTVLLNGVGLGLPPTIVFTVPNHTFGDPPFTVGATSNSPGAFTYSVVSGPATISGTTVTLTGAGVITLQANQAASGTFAAGSANASFTVAKEAQTINFVAPATPVAFGGSSIALVATATSGLPVSFSILSGPGSVSGNMLTLKGGGVIVIAADQPGNANFAAAAEVTRQVTVLYGIATVTLSANPNPVFLHNPLTLTATVASPSGSPGGSVVFQEGGTVIGSATLSGGSAPLTLSTLGIGSHTIQAIYSGDMNYASATSTSVVVVVQDFSLTILNPAVTIQHGGVAVYNIVVSSVGGVGLAQNITLSFSGGPDRSESTITPVTIATGSGNTAATLTMQTPNYPTGPFYFSATGSGRGVEVAALLGLMLVPLARRRLRRVLLMVLGVVLLGAVSGCGSGWKTQEFHVTVTATSGQLVRMASATLTSQP